MATKIAIAGAAGRMGRRIIALACADTAFNLVGALESPGSDLLGRDAGELAGIGQLGLAITI
ncbi:MAG: 4-hydroxy-tetrahydrodipicolinate reductase, partial [Planctomycetes bacterium UTPLA1]